MKIEVDDILVDKMNKIFGEIEINSLVNCILREEIESNINPMADVKILQELIEEMCCLDHEDINDIFLLETYHKWKSYKNRNTLLVFLEKNNFECK